MEGSDIEYVDTLLEESAEAIKLLEEALRHLNRNSFTEDLIKRIEAFIERAG